MDEFFNFDLAADPSDLVGSSRFNIAFADPGTEDSFTRMQSFPENSVPSL